MATVLDPAEIDALLPQTQCTRCGYHGCRPYAEAIVAGAAEINQCPPGGTTTIDALARLTGRPALPLNRDCGVEGPELVAVIDETLCIGCAKCLPPCPVDAIVGASRLMHTVIAEDCTGCELCIAPCPVDCITLVPRASVLPGLQASLNRQRFDARERRLARLSATQAALIAERKQLARR